MLDTKEKMCKLFFHSAEKMPEIQNESARIAIASPPFTDRVGGKILDKKEYLTFLYRVFSEIFRTLTPGGILATINTDLRDHARYNDGDSQFDGLIWQKHCAIRKEAERIGFQCFDTKIWAKTLNRNVYRYTFSYIQFFHKQGAKILLPLYPRTAEGFGPDVWLLQKGTHRRDSQGHVFRDAIHPVIAERCINQFTLPGDLAISPFTGSGTILSVANITGRRCVGYEIDRSLEPMIRESIDNPERLPAYRELLKRLSRCA